MYEGQQLGEVPGIPQLVLRLHRGGVGQPVLPRPRQAVSRNHLNIWPRLHLPLLVAPDPGPGLGVI